MLLALLPRHRFDALYADGPDLIGAGSFTPRGEAKVIDGGFEMTGRWPFASGCLHSKWLLANCVVTDNGHARPGPAQTFLRLALWSSAPSRHRFSTPGLFQACEEPAATI